MRFDQKRLLLLIAALGSAVFWLAPVTAHADAYECQDPGGLMSLVCTYKQAEKKCRGRQDKTCGTADDVIDKRFNAGVALQGCRFRVTHLSPECEMPREPERPDSTDCPTATRVYNCAMRMNFDGVNCDWTNVSDCLGGSSSRDGRGGDNGYGNRAHSSGQ